MNRETHGINMEEIAKQEITSSKQEELFESTAQDIQSKSFMQKLGDSAWAKRIIMLAGLLAGREMLTQQLSAQNKEGKDNKVKESIELAKKNLDEIIKQVKTKSDRSGDMSINGKRTKVFEKQINNRFIHTNDIYTYIKEEKVKDGNIKTEYGVDIGNDGSVEQIVMVPGKVDRAEDASIVTSFGGDKKSIGTDASLAGVERDISDKASLHRDVYFKDAKGGKWYMASFEDGVVQEMNDANTLQVWWEAKTAMTAVDIKSQDNPK
ncbi:MAG: hypothetical protein WC575_03060 [Patescibacteria group bacterium]